MGEVRLGLIRIGTLRDFVILPYVLTSQRDRLRTVLLVSQTRIALYAEQYNHCPQ
jgi:hypothetical protein